MDLEAELRRTIQEKRAVLVAGTGVSIAASRDPKTGKPHPQASWAGLLLDGLEWLEEHDLIPTPMAQAHRALLGKDAETHHFISAAQDVTKRFGGPASDHFEDWLARTVGTIQAHDSRLLEALEALRGHGNLLATTNYDGLLLAGNDALSPAIAGKGDDLLRAVRSRDLDKVLFLHGFWREPSTVVLDWDSYHQIARDDGYRHDLDAFWKTTTWVYVGCGVSGLTDPDLGLLLKRYGGRHRDAKLWDFCLVLASERESFQAEFDKRSLSIRAVPFGKDHGDLPGYLRSLLPAVSSITANEGLSQTVPTRLDGGSLGSQRLQPEDFSMSVVRRGKDSWLFSWKVRLRNRSSLFFEIHYLNETGHLVESQREPFFCPALSEVPEFHYGQHEINSELARQVRSAVLLVIA